MSSRAGQMYAGEFVISYFIFMIVLSLAFYMWGNTTQGLMESETFYAIEDAAVETAETLVRTPGNPSDWNASTVTSIGLADESRILNSNKIMAMAALLNNSNGNYEANRYLLGVGQYDMYVNLTYLNGSTLLINGAQAVAGSPPVNSTYQLTIVRTAIVNDTVVRIIVTAWQT
ncbi:Uncharacterised protein [uncultured archaeon]|nr:Uncharacterised protein [uncultured archaeon]